jgi:hypothetical protein
LMPCRAAAEVLAQLDTSKNPWSRRGLI